MKNWILATFALIASANLHAQSYSCYELEHPRIQVRYSQQEIDYWRSNDHKKIMYLNYLFKDSYVLINEHGAISTQFDPARTDILNFDHLRKENERVRFVISPNGDTIELKSKKEVEAEWKAILLLIPDC